MKIRKTRLFSNALFTMTLLWFSSFAFAAADSSQLNDVWHVLHAEGQTQAISVADLEAGKDWRGISTGEDLPGPSYLRTGPDSRIVLKHRNNKITIASSSLIKLEAEKLASEGIFTKIIQTVGYAIFDIEHNTGRTNLIETPYLVSVVKGTTFTVQVSNDRAIVNLIKGRLQINATNSSASTVINSGQSAQMGRGDTGISVLDTMVQINPALIGNNQASTTLATDAKSALKPVLAQTTSAVSGLTDTLGTSLTGVTDLAGATIAAGVPGVIETVNTVIPVDLSGTPIVSTVSSTTSSVTAPITSTVTSTTTSLAPVITQITSPTTTTTGGLIDPITTTTTSILP